VGRPVEQGVAGLLWKEVEGFNPRFGGEAGRTREISITPIKLPTCFNPRFGGEAGRTFKCPSITKSVRLVSIPDLVGRPVEPAKLWQENLQASGFNPRFGGEAGRTFVPVMADILAEGFNPRFGGEAGRTLLIPNMEQLHK